MFVKVSKILSKFWINFDKVYENGRQKFGEDLKNFTEIKGF